jgi:hypothetical protein
MNTRTFAMIFGVVFLILGLGGFIPGLTLMDHNGHQADSEVTLRSFFGYALGLFPVNVLHNLVHVIFGIWGILAAKSYAKSRGYFRVVAIAYGLFVVMGLIPGLRTTFGLIPLYGADIGLHAALALGGAYFGWMNRDTASERS